MYKRNNIHLLLMPCISDYISSVWPSIRTLTDQGAGNGGKAKSMFSPVFRILLPQWSPLSLVPSALLICSPLSHHPPVHLGLFHLTNKKWDKLSPPNLLLPWSIVSSFPPFFFTAKFLLKEVFTSLTSPILYSLFSLFDPCNFPETVFLKALRTT